MQKPLKILVIMTKKIGDTLLCTPLLSAIKEEHSNADIDFLAKYPASEILERNPDINKIYIINKTPWLKLISEIRKKRYDFIIDLYPTEKTALICALSKCENKIRGYFLRPKLYHRIYNIRPDYYATNQTYAPNRQIKFLEGILFKKVKTFPKMTLILPPDIHDIKKAFFKKYNISSDNLLIGFVPQGSHPLKMWPAESWKRLAELIIQKYSTKAKIFIFIDKNGQDFAKRMCPRDVKNIFIPQCENLTQLSSYISFLNLAVTVCTGTKHIAIALDVPTITIQTITNPNTWHPSGNPKHRLVSAQGLDCLYCDKTICNPATAPCLVNLKPELVFNELTNML